MRQPTLITELRKILVRSSCWARICFERSQVVRKRPLKDQLLSQHAKYGTSVGSDVTSSVRSRSSEISFSKLAVYLL